MKVFTDGTDTVVATDLADAQRAWEEFVGSSFEQEMKSIDDWREVDPDKSITIHNFDGHDGVMVLSAAQWADHNGRGFLCSTEW